MTDRELLEDAAKAAGVALYWSDDDPECDWVQGTYPRIPDYKVLEKWTWKVWNPLTDDGDALRLAVELGIDISLYAEKGGRVYAQSKHLLGFGTDGTPSYQAHEFMKEEYNGDPHAATRRAIVRAAAELGRSMK